MTELEVKELSQVVGRQRLLHTAIASSTFCVSLL